MNSDSVYLAFLGIAAIGALIAFSTGGGISALVGALLGVIGMVGAMAFKKYDYFLVPYILHGEKVVTINSDEYELLPEHGIVLKKTESGSYIASGFLHIQLYKSAMEMSEEAIVNYDKVYQRTLGTFKDIIKISYISLKVNMKKQAEQIKNKIKEVEKNIGVEKRKAKPDPLLIEKLERELDFWNKQINRTIKGEKPKKVMLVVMISQEGLSRDEALAKIKTKEIELKAAISNNLNCEVDRLSGEELESIIKWEEMLPVSAEDLEEIAEANSYE